MKSRVIFAIMSTLAITLLIYIAFAFITMKANPADWAVEARAFLVVFVVVISAALNAVLEFKP